MDSQNQNPNRKTNENALNLTRGFQGGEALYRAIYDEAPVMLHIADTNGNLLDVNQYWLSYLGYDREDVIGKRIIEFMPNNSSEYAKVYDLPKFLKSHIPTDIPYQIVTKDGMVIDVMISSVLERDQAGNEISLSVVHDISQLNVFKRDFTEITGMLEQRRVELEAVNQELESFSYSVSHDLRSPLRSIDGFSAMLLENCGAQLDAQNLDYLNRIRKNAQRMNELIEDLLNLSRISQIEMQKKPVNLSQLVESVIESLHQHDSLHQVEVSIEPDLTALADARLLKIALENLLNNAWKFSSKKEHPKIEFGVMSDSSQTEDSIAYYIKDNGAGFNMAYADKLFGAFQRLHKNSDFPGTGIGLATVQRIINRHGGKIWAESIVGEGSSFYFTLRS